MMLPQQFVTTVFEYCLWCEQPTHELSDARNLLLRLLIGVVDIEGVDSNQLDSVVIDEDRFDLQLNGEEATAFERLRDLPIQYYTQTHEPLDLNDMQAVVGDILDDLADIYGDLSEGVVEWQAGDRVDALETWDRNYRIHWGQHAISALTAIEAYLREQSQEV